MTVDGADQDSPSVVIYRSAITDIRTVEARLRKASLAFRVEVMSMTDQEERQRYRDLKQSSGFQTLPLIYVDGRCLGGEPELARYLADRPHVGVEDNDAAAQRAEEAPASEPPAAPSGEQDPVRETEKAPAAGAEEALTASPVATQEIVDVAPSNGSARTTVLGYGGLIPFVAGALLSVVGPYTEVAVQALVAYAAVIFSFVGAVHWGHALGSGTREGLVASVIPSLVGWGALGLMQWQGANLALGCMVIGFVLWHIFEQMQARMPPDYLRLRLRLTLIVSTLLAASAVLRQLSG